MKLFTSLLSLLTIASSALAIDLSPSEQAQLNALPPALRAQAMEKIKQYEASQGSTSTQSVERPEVVKAKTAPTNAEVEADFEAATDIASTTEQPTAKQTKRDLKQFGYDLFAGTPTTFAPATEIPVPADYILGPGDQIRIQFFGKESASYDLYISREGILNVPELGPISVAGQLFTELKSEIGRRVSEQMIGVEAFISLGELRSIRVFILGDVTRPGSYTVSALSTLTNALFVSGGINPIGSLRNIQLKRGGNVVAELDLYDLLIRGDTSGDARIQPGDVIFVPPVGSLVGISGEVKRPAIYELKGESTLSELVSIAGGFTAQAYPSLTQIERITSGGIKEVLDIDLSESNNSNFELNNGDLAQIYSTLDRADNVVTVSGQAERNGNYQWAEGLRIRDVITSYADLVPTADLDYALVVSRDPINGLISTRSFSLKGALGSENSIHNLNLFARDQILIFDSQSSNRAQLSRIVSQLESQATSGEPQKIVSISGHVRHPGRYPLDTEMQMSDLIRAAGGYSQEAYTLEAELLRYVDNGKQQRETVLVPVNLSAKAKSAKDLKLQSFDQIMIKRIPDWGDQEKIVLTGEFRFPGTYTIERGETLSHVIARAGGLTDLASPQAAVFLRESLRKSEAAQITKLRERLKDDVSAAKLREGELSNASISTAEQLLGELENTTATGRLVINLASLLSGSTENDVTIKAGDQLMVPQAPESVTIIGSVNYPTSHFFQDGLSREDYIGLSGGLLKRADKQQIYVVRANGQVSVDTRSRFFPKSSLEIMPGDTIVVPVDVDRMKPLKYWGSVSQIVYQLALGAAAVNSF